MNTMDSRFDFGITISQAMAAFAGAVAQVVIFPPKSKAWAVVMIIAGTLAAAYLSPLVVHLMNLDAKPGPVANAVVFLTGAFGMMLLSGIGKAVSAFRENPAIALEWWRKWRGGDK